METNCVFHTFQDKPGLLVVTPMKMFTITKVSTEFSLYLLVHFRISKITSSSLIYCLCTNAGTKLLQKDQLQLCYCEMKTLHTEKMLKGNQIYLWYLPVGY